MTRLKILTRGIIKENPVLVLLLGLCPALAVSTQAENAIGMGLATTAVLLGSNVVISLLRNIIPDKVRIPSYIVLIAGFVTLVAMVLEAYAYSMHQALGIFLPLIAVNCIVFARAEVFAKKNTPLDSAIDALGMGAGFTLALLIVASLREIFGNGTWFGIEIFLLQDNAIAIFTMAPGGFIVLAFVIAFVNKMLKNRVMKRSDFGCAQCPAAATCKQLASNE
jgi:electron transport complex protein RnfE